MGEKHSVCGRRVSGAFNSFLATNSVERVIARFCPTIRDRETVFATNIDFRAWGVGHLAMPGGMRYTGGMMDVILSHLPWFWLGVMLLCIAFEAATQALTTIWFGCGALVLVFVSMTPLPFRWQLLLFALVSLALLVFTRPFFYQKLRIKKQSLNADSLVGKRALVVQDISELQKGAVKVNGIEWTAAATEPIAAGAEVVITGIAGATAQVQRVAQGQGSE